MPNGRHQVRVMAELLASYTSWWCWIKLRWQHSHTLTAREECWAEGGKNM